MVNMSRLVLWRAQVMSICETQYSGASVILISPDSDNPLRPAGAFCIVA